MIEERVLVVFVLISAMVTLYHIVAAGFSGRRAGASLRARAELQTKVLDRLGSGREVIEFSQTEGGKQFIEALSTENVRGVSSKGSPTEKILAAVQKGIILTLLGLGLVILALKYRREDLGEFFTVIGVVGLSLGIGFFAFRRGFLPAIQEDSAVRGAFFKAAGTLRSDGEHCRVLSALAARKPSVETLQSILQSSKGISSDGEKAELLIAMAGACVDNKELLVSFLEVSNSLSSDGEYRRVLWILFEDKNFLKKVALQNRN